MLPGKKFTVDDVIRILLRRAWIVVLTLALGGGIAFGISKMLPNQYRSETLIMVIPQQISETYVRAQVTTKIEDRLNSLEDQILSRSRLESIINDLKLYPELRRTLPMEDVVQRMRDNDITVKVEGKEAFRISYISQESKTAQRTAERLASLFIEESMRDRENRAEDTHQFIESQLEDAKRRLQTQEKKLEEYRSKYGNELPTQVATNLQGIQNAQLQLQNNSDTADRARERRILLERQLADLEDNSPFAALPAGPAAADPAAAGSPEQQLQALRAELTAKQVHLKPEHPDIKDLQRRIGVLEKKVQAQKDLPATPTQAIDELPPAERTRQQRIRETKLQIEDIDRQLAEKQEAEKKLRATVADYQAKLDAAPKRESDLVELTRDNTTLQASYQNLLTKREDAKMAADLGRRNIGEQFKVLDPAKAPERPFSPNRIAIDLGGASAGLFLGLLIVGLLEFSDSTFKSETDVVRVLDLRVLALVPHMASNAERRTKKWRVALFTMAVMVVGGSASAALVLWRLRH